MDAATTGANKKRDDADSRNGKTVNPGTDTAEKSRGRGRPRKQEEEQFLGLASLEPKIVEVEVPQQSNDKKEKAKKTKSKTKAAKVDTTQIQLLLVTISGLIASRPGMEIWNLTADEAKQIAEPLGNILAKNDALSNAVGEHADALALVSACFMIFVPKLVIYLSTKPKKAKEGSKVEYGNRRLAESQNKERSAGRIAESNARANTSTPKNVSKNFSGQLSELIPVI